MNRERVDPKWGDVGRCGEVNWAGQSMIFVVLRATVDFGEVLVLDTNMREIYSIGSKQRFYWESRFWHHAKDVP